MAQNRGVGSKIERESERDRERERRRRRRRRRREKRDGKDLKKNHRVGISLLRKWPSEFGTYQLYYGTLLLWNYNQISLI